MARQFSDLENVMRVERATILPPVASSVIVSKTTAFAWFMLVVATITIVTAALVIFYGC
jgi:hypothetical protein